MYLGSHMSISGGIEKAPLRGATVGCRAIQIFTKSSNNWTAKPLLESNILKFKENLKVAGISKVVAHDSYLINLASPKDELFHKSTEALLIEIERAEKLGVSYLVFHPGNHMGEGMENGIKRISMALNEILKKTGDFSVKLALEATAGQGTSVGYKFSQLGDIIKQSDMPEKLFVCIDTCHIFAAGYDITTLAGYKKTFKEANETFGIEKIVAFHLNDSKKELGSRVDRHEHIGKGFLGLEPFKFIVNDKRFKELPMILETPKGPDMKEDIENLNILRGLIDK